MNRWLVLLLLVLTGNAAFYAGAHFDRRDVQRSCQALNMFAAAERVWMCEERASIRTRLEGERRKVETLERGSP